MAKWTVNVGDEVIVVERRGDAVVIDIPSGRPVTAQRREVEDLRLKLGAAIADAGDQQ